MSDLDPPVRRAALVVGPPQLLLIAGSVATAAVVGLGTLRPAGALGPSTVALVPLIASACAALAMSVASRRASGIDRAIRSWVAVAAWAWSLGHLLRALAGHADRLDGGSLATTLFVGGFAAATGFAVVVARRAHTPLGRSLMLDATVVTGAAILAVFVVVGDRFGRAAPGEAALAIVLPAMALAAVGLVVLTALARRSRWSAYGVAPAILGILVLGVGWIVGPRITASGAIVLGEAWALSQALGWLLLAHGVTTFRDADRAGRSLRRLASVVQAAVTATAIVIVATVATFDDVFIAADLWPAAVAVFAVTLGAVVMRQAIATRQRERSFGRMSRTVRAARIERRRAEAARAAERERADVASLILAVSEDLRQGDAPASYETALRRITPGRCRASIARLDDERTEFTRIAAIGPDPAVACTCLVATMPGDIGDLLHGRLVGRRRDDGPPGQGIVATVSPTSALGGDVHSSLTVPIRRADGWLLGALHLEDLEGERIHSPAFVALARSTANQLAGSFNTDALLERLRREIVERDRIQAELIQASRAKAVGELAGAVAHEVNNPLTGILGYAELLLDGLPPSDARREDLVVIRDEAKRARSIVRALVDLAQTRTGTRTVTTIAEVVREAARTTRSRAVAAGIVLTEAHGPVPAVTVDRTAIGAVVVALIDNAIAAMLDGGAIRVETSAEPDRAVLKVSDTGRGMEPDVVRRAFDPFFSTHDARAGRGMGLAIALGVVRDHGGSMWIESTPGSGTTIEIRLPTAADPGPDANGGAALPDSAGQNRVEVTA